MPNFPKILINLMTLERLNYHPFFSMCNLLCCTSPAIMSIISSITPMKPLNVVCVVVSYGVLMKCSVWGVSVSKQGNKRGHLASMCEPYIDDNRLVPLLVNIHNEILSFWWNFHPWLHWTLSKWQRPVLPVMKVLSKWWHFHFSACSVISILH